MKPASRKTSATNRWGSSPTRGRLKRPCPKCGAPAYASCFKVRTLRVTGQDLSLPDPSYEVRLKVLHRER